MAGLSVKGEETLVLTQSAIGEINRLTIKIPGQGRIFAAERPKARCESDFSQELLPDSSNYKQVPAVAPSLACTRVISLFDEHSI